MDAKAWNGEPEAEHDPNASGHGEPYVCRDCDWTGRGVKALDHYVSSGHTHRIRGRDWPASWADADFPVYNFQRTYQAAKKRAKRTA